MDDKIKKLLSITLGEVLRVQRKLDICNYSDAKIYGLLRGIEPVIDEIIDTNCYVTKEQFEAVSKILNRYYSDKEMLAELTGYYDIENELSSHGIGRGEALVIFTYFYKNRQFVDVIEKFNSDNSPSECREFNILFGVEDN